MISSFKLIIVFFVLCYFHVHIFLEYLNIGKLMPTIAFSILVSAVSMLAYIHGKWFAYTYKKTFKSLSNDIFVFENILMPVSLFCLFGIPFSGLAALFDKIFFSSIFISLILLFDINNKLSEYIWSVRFQEYEKYPEDGILDPFLIRKKRNLIYGFFILFPIVGVFLFFIVPVR